MAIALVQRRANANNNSANLAVPISSASSNGLLVAVIFTRSATVTNPTGFTTAEEFENTTNSDWIRIAYKVAAGGETSVQWTNLEGAGDGFGACSAVYEFSGTDTSSPFDTSADGGAIGIGVTSRSTGTTATLAQAAEVCIAAYGFRDTNPASPDFSNGGNTYTIGPGPDANPATDGGGSGPAYLLDGYKIVAATTAQSCTVSWTGATNGVISCIATFKEGAGGGAAPVSIVPIIQNYRHMGLMQ